MTQQTIVLASQNKGKLAEFNQLFAKAKLPITVKSQQQLCVPEVEETGLSFIENALIKARNASSITGLASIADDSGIEVDSLNGAPGIYSARFAGEHASDQDNNNKLIQLLTNQTNRTARYHCILVFMRHEFDPTPVICQGSWQGSIIDQPKGTGGFGYDPHFWLDDLEKTAAELSPDHKNKISHRGLAMHELMTKLDLLLRSA